LSGGKTHEKLNHLFLFLSLVAVLLIPLYFLFGIRAVFYGLVLIFGYLLGTFYLNPDLDIKSRPFYRWGFLRFIWIPYQKVFHHRSIFTHGIIIGDIIRVLYLYFSLYFLYYIAFSILQLETFSIEEAIMLFHPISTYFTPLFVGLCLSSIAHIIVDHASSGYKRTKKKFKRK
jgi:uncharacterized metal-binding protein